MRKSWRLGLLVIGTQLSFIAISLSNVQAVSDNLSHSYQSTASVPTGSIVSLDPLHSSYVQLANISNGARLLGVAVNSRDSLLAVNAANDRVQIATDGTAATLVSTLDGNIKVGDLIGVSPLDGIGMKALSGSRVIGLAQTAFNANTSGAISKTITDKSGHASSVKVGYVELNVAVGTNATVLNSNLNVLQKFAQTITGHVVSPTRVIISLVVALLALLALITLIYGAIYGSIISIGRNPLAKHTVIRNLTLVFVMVLLIALVAGTIDYFLLR
jgi:hypothetical protein